MFKRLRPRPNRLPCPVDGCKGLRDTDSQRPVCFACWTRLPRHVRTAYEAGTAAQDAVIASANMERDRLAHPDTEPHTCGACGLSKRREAPVTCIRPTEHYPDASRALADAIARKRGPFYLPQEGGGANV